MLCSRAAFSFCSVLAALAALPVHAGTLPAPLTLPANVEDALQERAQALSHLMSTWQRSDKEQIFCSLSPAQMKDAREKELEGSEADYRKRGITDEAQIKRDAEESTQNIMAALEGGFVDYTNTWTFQRNGPATLVSGTTQTFNGFLTTSRQFYENHLALAVTDESRFKGKAISTQDATVWRTSGDSTSYPAPGAGGLDISPEHFALLAGSNPLTLRGINWKLQSQSAQSLVLKAGFMEEHTAWNATLTLAVKNGYAPSKIVVRCPSITERYTASHFRRYNDSWVSDRVEYSKNAPGFVQENQVWTLQTLTPSAPIEVPVTGKDTVRDFRFVGADLSSTNLMRAGMPQDRRFGKIITYRWPGSFPSDTEVDQMFEKQHPGEPLPATTPGNA